MFLGVEPITVYICSLIYYGHEHLYVKLPEQSVPLYIIVVSNTIKGLAESAIRGLVLEYLNNNKLEFIQ